MPPSSSASSPDFSCIARTKSPIWSSASAGRLDDEVDALAEHVEVEVGDQRGDLDERVGRRGRARSSRSRSRPVVRSQGAHYRDPLWQGRRSAVRHSAHLAGCSAFAQGRFLEWLVVKEWFGLVARLVMGGGRIWAGLLEAARPRGQRPRRARLRAAARSRSSRPSVTCSRCSRSSSAPAWCSGCSPAASPSLRAVLRRLHHRHRVGVGARHRDRLRLLRRRRRTRERRTASTPWEIARDVGLLLLSV